MKSFAQIDTTVNMVREGHLIPASDFKSRMSWKAPSSLPRALVAGRVFSLMYEGQEHYPAFFADPLLSRKQLYSVTRMLGDLHGGGKMQFFLARKGSLSGETPLQVLAAGGRLDEILRLAGAYSEA